MGDECTRAVAGHQLAYPILCHHFLHASNDLRLVLVHEEEQGLVKILNKVHSFMNTVEEGDLELKKSVNSQFPKFHVLLSLQVKQFN